MKRCHRETNISELPNEILAHILTKLPIEEAVRTSSLTKQWRHIYTEMPRLQFTEDSDRIHWKKDSDGCASNEWLSIIDRLLDRIGPSIETFVLSHNLYHHGPHVNRFINRLQNKSMKALFIFNNSEFSIPVQVFRHCRTLVVLYLINCRVQIPDGFVGFPCLKFLRVCSNTSVETYQRLIARCPCLERLCILVYCDSPCTTLQIGDLQHLKLLKLCVRGGLLKVKGLELIPPLQKVELIVCWQGGRSNEEDEYSIMKEFFKRENGVRHLSLVTRSITNSTIIEATFLNLTCVTIKMDFTELAAMEGFSRILRNAPKLQEISVKNVPARRLRSTWQQDFWDKQGEPFQCLSKNVRIIDMHGIKFSCSHSMWFVMFLAKSARVLKKLELNVLRDTQMSPLIEEELHLVKPASTDLNFVLNLMDG